MISVPVAVLVGVYLVEYGSGRLAKITTFMVDILTGIPSIVAALFIYALAIQTFGFRLAGWLVSLALVILGNATSTGNGAGGTNSTASSSNEVNEHGKSNVIASILATIAPRRAPSPRHPAVRRMCTYLDRSDPVDLARLSREAGLSPRQMRHAFGLSFWPNRTV